MNKKTLKVVVPYSDMMGPDTNLVKQLVMQKLKDAGFDLKQTYYQSDSYANGEITFTQEVEWSNGTEK